MLELDLSDMKYTYQIGTAFCAVCSKRHLCDMVFVNTFWRRIDFLFLLLVVAHPVLTSMLVFYPHSLGRC